MPCQMYLEGSPSIADYPLASLLLLPKHKISPIVFVSVKQNREEITDGASNSKMIYCFIILLYSEGRGKPLLFYIFCVK